MAFDLVRLVFFGICGVFSIRYLLKYICSLSIVISWELQFATISGVNSARV